jgi:hypothetical protein
MNWNIRIHGDNIEIKYIDFIQDNIPYYSLIWELYIGNDGSNQLAEIKNISEIDNHNRLIFALCNYTCFESLLLIKSIVVEETRDKDYDGYLKLLNNHLAFQANMGRIRDNVRKICYTLNLPDNILHDFEVFWEHRNNTLHEFKLPYSFIDSEFVTIIPDDETIRELYQIRYNTYTDLKFRFASEYYKNSYNDLLIKYNGFLAITYNKIKELMKSKKYSLSDPKLIDDLITNSGIIGTTFVDLDAPDASIIPEVKKRNK